MTLPFDQIPPERRTLGDFTGRLDGHNGVLGIALAQWMARDDTKAQPAIRQAANRAMDEIDGCRRRDPDRSQRQPEPGIERHLELLGLRPRCLCCSGNWLRRGGQRRVKGSGRGRVQAA